MGDAEKNPGESEQGSLNIRHRQAWLDTLKKIKACRLPSVQKRGKAAKEQREEKENEFMLFTYISIFVFTIPTNSSII